MAVEEKIKRNWQIEDEFSEPARLLQEQAKTIREETDGVLYGIVKKDILPPVNGVGYHLDVGIEGNVFRSSSISIRHKRDAEYPVIVTNMLEGDGMKVADAEAFKQRVCDILHDSTTLAQYKRMIEYAKKP